MARDWQELYRLTQGAPVLVERVRLVDSDIAIEGSFEDLKQLLDPRQGSTDEPNEARP